jgi:hypothetical protein|tara:strand:+ start:738 stop:1412 length:675 start_codon:yes stop_codon:yes gene_type:complete
MPWFRRNGSAIGDPRNQAANQTGIWDLNDAHQLRNSNSWGTVPDTFHYGSALSDSDYVVENPTYVEVKMSFASGNVPQACMFAWMHMMDHTPASVTRWDIYQSNISSGTSPAVSLTNSTQATSIATSLRNGTTSGNQGGWEVSLGCVNTSAWNSFTSAGGSTGGVLNDSTNNSYCRVLHQDSINYCGGVSSSQWNIRPHIGNQNWGGVNINGGTSVWIKVRATK